MDKNKIKTIFFHTFQTYTNEARLALNFVGIVFLLSLLPMKNKCTRTNTISIAFETIKCRRCIRVRETEWTMEENEKKEVSCNNATCNHTRSYRLVKRLKQKTDFVCVFFYPRNCIEERRHLLDQIYVLFFFCWSTSAITKPTHSLFTFIIKRGELNLKRTLHTCIDSWQIHVHTCSYIHVHTFAWSFATTHTTHAVSTAEMNDIEYLLASLLRAL